MDHRRKINVLHQNSLNIKHTAKYGKRGYYSELVSRLINEEDKIQNAESPIKTRNCRHPTGLGKFMPTLPTLKPPTDDIRVLSTGRWRIYDDDQRTKFPVETFFPKRQLMNVVLPRKEPRLVMIERMRREFASFNLKELLLERKIEALMLSPVKCFKNSVDIFNEPNQIRPRMDLYIFDNTDYDNRNPEEWLSLGDVDGTRGPIPASAYLPIVPNEDSESEMCSAHDWIDVAVTNYDPQTQMWNVRRLDAGGKSYNVYRMFLFFKAEDPRVFADRIKAAIDLRSEIENTIKYHLYIDCCILSGLPQMPHHLLRKILKQVSLLRLKRDVSRQSLIGLRKEVKLSHKKANADMRFRNIIAKYPEKMRFISLPPPNWKKKVPDKGCISSNFTDYSSVRKYTQWFSLWSVPEALSAYYIVVAECLVLESKCFFNMSLGRNLGLDEFETIQNNAISNMFRYIHLNWLDNIVFGINCNLQDINSGWYNTHVKWNIYKVSKLYRLMELIRFRMQCALRALIDSSMSLFVVTCEAPCICTFGCPDDYEWDASDLINSPFDTTLGIFHITIEIGKDGPMYTEGMVDKFNIVMQRLFYDILYKSHFIRQVTPRILKNIVFEKELYLSSIGLLEPNAVEYKSRLEFAYEKAIIPVKAFARRFNVFQELCQMDIEEYMQEFKSEERSMEEIRDEIQTHFDHLEDLLLLLPLRVNIGPFIVHVDSLKYQLMKKRSDLIQALLDMVTADMKLKVEDVLVAYKEAVKKIGERPITVEQIFEIREWMETIPLTIMMQTDIMKAIFRDCNMLYPYNFTLDNDLCAIVWEAKGWPYKISNMVEDTLDTLAQEQDNFLKIHQTDELTFLEKIHEFTSQCTALSLQSDIDSVQEIANDIRKAWKALKESQEYGQLLNRRQKLFQMNITPYEDLDKLVKEFEPYKNLWVTASEFYNWRMQWMDNPLLQVEADVIESIVDDYYKLICKCIRIFNDLPAVQGVAKKVKADIEDFRPLIPIIMAVKNPGLKERHWKEFMEESGITITMNDKQTFRMCLNQGIRQYGHLVEEIGELASKEYAIEQALDKMHQEWADKTMDITPYKNTGTFIMKIPDETLQMMDDHLQITQQLGFSPFRLSFELQISEWDEKLRLAQTVAGEWIECQKQWMYLEPIFTSEDIIKALPFETKKYNSMERSWKHIMLFAIEMPRIMVQCPNTVLLETLRESIKYLEIAAKGLAEYMQLKRSYFPRFYFLSDDELLEILSRAKEPLTVQPHLRKCFENIAMLTFESDRKITAMHSNEGEIVPLRYTFYPRGNVESWLSLLENSMKNTVRLVLLDALKDLHVRDRCEWVRAWPGQVVIACSQISWTSAVEEAIVTDTLGDCYNGVLEKLDGLRGLVKENLSFLEREILSALIVIEVHARDITKVLLDVRVKNVFDFEWISQLRYYVQGEETPLVPEPVLPEDKQNDELLDTSAFFSQFSGQQVFVKALNTCFPYANEYLGNSGRLVITPLTDRCYLTLLGALHLKFGGAPAGPAGTGKTETTKDLAKALAVQCVVFNCSDQLDYMAMGKFFKGLASSGAWACFDEFNRIEVEVLSVIAQQVVTIQRAQQQRLKKFIFERMEIPLSPMCAVFITMNPGYAGRAELPDNLKALFRPVSMMVPNYALIVEISLFSFGFSRAKTLARKTTTAFKLCSEQLSVQDHYDFGMRAVKTVITVAGNLIRQLGDTLSEKQIVLRALRDVNVPKFLKDDLILFNGIISDLFPRVTSSKVDHGILESSIRTWTVKLGCDVVDSYVHKVIQLYETTVVRHGLMLVGPAGSGKTKSYEILKNAMTSLKGKPCPDGTPFTPVYTHALNPKSITMGLLYGEFDNQTHEWTDGILSNLVRKGIAAEGKEKYWYIFDGPVDAVWIENMNTVLDDNKKLCLASGEIMKLTEHQRMIFEVEDLAVASPATVSRCGMVYIDSSVVGLRPLLNSWLKKDLPQLAAGYREQFKKLFDAYIYPALKYLRAAMQEMLPSSDSALVHKFLELMSWRLRPLTGKDGKPPPAMAFQKNIVNLAPCWVIWSLIWSIGATCDGDSRMKFSNYVRKYMEKRKEVPLFPDEGSVYDYKLHDGGFTDVTENDEPALPTWLNWMNDISKPTIRLDMNFTDIQVPTIDTIRSSYILSIKLAGGESALCVGPPGSGKTWTVCSKLQRQPPPNLNSDFIVFSARTSAKETQDLIESKLGKRHRCVLGPAFNKKQVFFIDDLNMPTVEKYGAQPPIELLRQWMDFKGWYDRRNIGDFISLVDTSFVCAVTPRGGRNPVTMRLLRHFHYIGFTEMENDSKREIFGTIFQAWANHTQGCSDIIEPILKATLVVFSTIISDLLPTPAKCHYTFNLRDLAKVFQGILMMDPNTIKDTSAITKLWFHENCRVYRDRLVNDIDRSWLDELLKLQISEVLQMDNASYGDSDKFFYGDFMDDTTDEKKYVAIDDMNQLKEVLQLYMDEYNAVNSVPCDLVLFEDAISHICRLSRILRQPMGNALLLGMGGSGRQSYTRLVCHMAEMTLFTIEVTQGYNNNNWKEDIKTVMSKAGLENRQTVFLISDSQIKMESFLEDINNILSSGDVPNIYQPEDLEKIYTVMRLPVMQSGLPVTESSLVSGYQKRIRCNLHMVICMSPIGEIFRSRMRQFPSLINCCAVNWYSAWSDSALKDVALRSMKRVPELVLTDARMHGLVNTCKFAHQSVIEESKLFLTRLGRHNYVTPASYVEMLASFSELFMMKKGEIHKQYDALRTGLSKLYETEEAVGILQLELAELKPQMEAAAVEMEEVIRKIEIDTATTEEAKKHVEKEQEVAEKIKHETEILAADAQQDLDLALPALIAAEKSLKSLNKNDIVEVKAMKTPPAGVVQVIESLCIVFDIKPIKMPGLRFGQKILDYWKPGSMMLSDAGAFLDTLMNFDKESITPQMIHHLKKFVVDPNFQPAKIKKVSKACMSLCQWVHAMYKFYHINKMVEPKKVALQNAKEKLAQSENILKSAKERVDKLIDGINKLKEYLTEKEAEKLNMEQGIEQCMARMNRAVRLIAGLGNEKIRWISKIAELEDALKNATGDILISACAVAYLTPFTSSYRQNLLEMWSKMIIEYDLPHSVGCDPTSVLGNLSTIRSWQLCGLPRDNMSTQNAILVMHSRRWPLFIDPQAQANSWIRTMCMPDDLIICKQNDQNLLQRFEAAICFGKPILLENIGTSLETALDPILKKQLFQQAGQTVVQIGDSIIPYSESFRLFITTKLSNPHYTPEISVKVQIVNFALVPSGLEEQLLSITVACERSELETQRSMLIASNADMNSQLARMQERILRGLCESVGSPVDDEELINVLEAIKIKSDEISKKVIESEITQKRIESTRRVYVPVAERGTILFFCLADLSTVDYMYQNSLAWFQKIFIDSMKNAEPNDIVNERVKIIKEYLTYSLYSGACRGLFQKHKIHFAFLLCTRVLLQEGSIDSAEYDFLLSGSTLSTTKLPNPDPSWITPKLWQDILSLSVLDNLKVVVETFGDHIEHYKNMYHADDPQAFPMPTNVNLTLFQKLLVIKVLRLDKLAKAMQDFIVCVFGERFVESQTADLMDVYKESTPSAPLIFVLSTGADPAEDLFKFANRMKMSKRLQVISLGQGQGARAEIMFENACSDGSWIFFQNCHLSPSWMPTLETLVEKISPDKVHKDFRLWLTSMPSPHFPIALLQNGIKMIMEPPRGIKANIQKAYYSQVTDFANMFTLETEKAYNFKSLLFSLCLFHAVVLERNKFGRLGFNVPYEFTDGDLRICIQQLHMFLTEYEEIPMKMLIHVTGHINYGGRVTDEWDRRCLLAILTDHYNNDVLEETHQFDVAGVYHQIPYDSQFKSYLDYVKTLPINDDPNIFGLHSNANITYARMESMACLDTLKSLEAGSTEMEYSVENIENIAKYVLDKTPKLLPIDKIARKFPVDYDESLNAVLIQEAVRYNKLLVTIRKTVDDLLKGVKGLLVMSDSLEELANNLAVNKVPVLWSAKAYPSLKPLGAWVLDLAARITFIRHWVKHGIPSAFWISGFYSPQALLTGVLQNYGRKNVISIDTIEFNFDILDEKPKYTPLNGCCVYGLFLEGAQWDRINRCLADSLTSELTTEMPPIFLRPELYRPKANSLYECPSYRTKARSHFVLTFNLPSGDKDPRFWIKRGTALINELDY